MPSDTSPDAPALTDAPGTDPGRPPTRAQIRRWRNYLADELAEAAIYRDLAERREGHEQDILLALADAEGRHQQHWRSLLGEHAEPAPRPGVRVRIFRILSHVVGSLVMLVLLQRAETRSPYEREADATEEMAADERIHAEVVRGLAARGRAQLSGSFRAAVFGANDGLVSNLALVMGMAGTGVSNGIVLASGISGLLAGALSMGAGEFVSISSQRELLEASSADPETYHVVDKLDFDQNELELVFRARGMGDAEAHAQAQDLLLGRRAQVSGLQPEAHEEIGSPWGAALSSFGFFAAGAVIPILPYLFGAGGLEAAGISVGLVGLALLGTGATVGLLSGAASWRRALRQLAIGLGAAGVTYVLGLLFGTSIS